MAPAPPLRRLILLWFQFGVSRQGMQVHTHCSGSRRQPPSFIATFDFNHYCAFRKKDACGLHKDLGDPRPPKPARLRPLSFPGDRPVRRFNLRELFQTLPR
ncbi:hypothetical protein PVAP13_2KG222472 [Panicum virgatum]|uniref:Secreted protein n=1 Tax=Panicum virgatum TaxID=38727 RepID=A0A8T0W5R4_PANVG|nr:hypothetical protein PVAP13_2KG222472 [Panicum virgatum]